MTITPEDVKNLTKATPQEEGLVKAGITLQAYQNASQKLGGYVAAATSNIYGDSKAWNPVGVIDAIKKYSDIINDLIGKKEELIKGDQLLGSTFADYLAEKSKSAVTLKNMALPWLENIINSTTYGITEAEITEEFAKTKKEAAKEQLPKLEELVDKVTSYYFSNYS